MLIRKAAEKDVHGITAIYNDAIMNTTATFDTEPKDPAERAEWLRTHSDKYPVLVAVEDDLVLGWASLSRWSDRCAYNDTAEISIYIHPVHRDKGLGKALMQAIVEAGKQGGLHCVLSRITQDNKKSIYLHELSGFVHVGILREVGRKFGTLLDVHMMQLIYQ